MQHIFQLHLIHLLELSQIDFEPKLTDQLVHLKLNTSLDDSSTFVLE